MFFLILAAILDICKLDGEGAISQLANIDFWIQHTRIPLKMISNPFPHKCLYLHNEASFLIFCLNYLDHVLRGNLFARSQDIKEAAYKGLVRRVLEYRSSLWDPHIKGLQEELEKVQNRAARFVTRNYTFEEGLKA